MPPNTHTASVEEALSRLRQKSLNATQKKASVTSLVDLLKGDRTAARQSLARSSRKTDARVSWHMVIENVVTVIASDSSKKKTTAIWTWQQLKTLCQIAESDGHFLADSIESVIVAMENALDDSTSHAALESIMFICQTLLPVARYQTRIRRQFYSRMYTLFSRAFLKHDDAPGALVRDQGLDAALHLLNSRAVLCADVLDLLLNSYPYDVSVLLRAKALPFLKKYIKQYCLQLGAEQKNPRASRNSNIFSPVSAPSLLRGIRRALSKNAMNVIGAFQELMSEETMSHIVMLYRHIQSPAVKIELARLLALAFRVQDHVPIEFGAFSSSAEAHTLRHLYAHVFESFHQGTVFASSSSNALTAYPTLDEHSRALLQMAIGLLARVEGPQAESKSSERNGENDDAASCVGYNEVQAEQRATKRRKIDHRGDGRRRRVTKKFPIVPFLASDSFRPGHLPCTVTWLKFLFSFLECHFDWVSDDQYDAILQHLIDAVNQFKKRDTERRSLLWTLAALFQLTLVSRESRPMHNSAEKWLRLWELLASILQRSERTEVSGFVFAVLGNLVLERRVEHQAISQLQPILSKLAFLKRNAFDRASMAAIRFFAIYASSVYAQQSDAISREFILSYVLRFSTDPQDATPARGVDTTSAFRCVCHAIFCVTRTAAEFDRAVFDWQPIPDPERALYVSPADIHLVNFENADYVFEFAQFAPLINSDYEHDRPTERAAREDAAQESDKSHDFADSGGEERLRTTVLTTLVARVEELSDYVDKEPQKIEGHRILGITRSALRYLFVIFHARKAWNISKEGPILSNAHKLHELSMNIVCDCLDILVRVLNVETSKMELVKQHPSLIYQVCEMLAEGRSFFNKCKRTIPRAAVVGHDEDDEEDEDVETLIRSHLEALPDVLTQMVLASHFDSSEAELDDPKENGSSENDTVMEDNVDEFWNEYATQHKSDQNRSKLSVSSLQTPRKDASFIFTPDANDASEDQVLSERPPMLPDWRCAVVRLLCELGECRSFVEKSSLENFQRMFAELTLYVDVARDEDLFFANEVLYLLCISHDDLSTLQGAFKKRVFAPFRKLDSNNNLRAAVLLLLLRVVKAVERKSIRLAEEDEIIAAAKSIYIDPGRLNRHAALMLVEAVIPCENAEIGDFTEVLMDWVKSSDFVVRTRTVAAAQHVLLLYECHEEIFQEFAEPAIETVFSKMSLSLQLSALTTLGHLALFSMKYERAILFIFCRAMVDRPELRNCISLIYLQLSARLGYSTDPTSTNSPVNTLSHASSLSNSFSSSSMLHQHSQRSWSQSSSSASYIYWPSRVSTSDSSRRGGDSHKLSPQRSLSASIDSRKRRRGTLMSDHFVYLIQRWINGWCCFPQIGALEKGVKDYRESKESQLQRSLADFPVELLPVPASKRTKEERVAWFLQEFEGPILCTLMFKRNEAALTEFARSRNDSIGGLCRRHFSMLFAHTYAMFTPDYETAEKICDFFKGMLGEAFMTDNLRRYSTRIALETMRFHIEWDALPFIQKSFENLAAQDGVTLDEYVCSKKNHRVRQMLLEISIRLTHDHRFERRAQLYRFLKELVLKFINEKLIAPSTFRSALNIALRLLSRCKTVPFGTDRALETHLAPSDLVTFIHSLCRHSLNIQDDGSHLARFVRTVIDSLTAFVSAQLEEIQAMRAITAEKTKQRTSAEQCVRQVMATLVGLLGLQQKPAMLEQYRELDSFPRHAVFSKARAILAPLRQQQTLRSEIRRFIRNVDDGASPALTERTLLAVSSRVEFLRECFSNRKSELRDLLRSDNLVAVTAPDSPRGDDSDEDESSASTSSKRRKKKAKKKSAAKSDEDDRSIVSSLLRKLMYLCGITGSRESLVKNIRSAAGKCLGELGILDPTLLDFSSSKDINPNRNSPGCLNSFDKLTQNKRILSALAEYVDDSDSVIQFIASDALIHILADSDATPSFQMLEMDTSQFLQPFLPVLSKSERSARQIALPFELVSISEFKPTYDVWKYEGKSFSEWIRVLSARLAADSAGLVLEHDIANPLLPRLAQVCLYRETFASSLFGYLIVLQLTASHSEADAVRLADRFNVLFRHSPPIDHGAVRLLLDTVLAIRQHAFLRSRDLTRRGGRKGVRRTASSTRSWNDVKAFAAFENHLDLLAVAESAQRSQSYHSAYFYLELWCARTFPELDLVHVLRQREGGNSLGEEKSSQENLDALDRCRDLLVETYHNMSEPDGIYGLVRDGHRSSEFYLYEHEGSWTDAFQSYDSALSGAGTFISSLRHSDARDEAAQVSADSSSSHMSSLFAQRGLMQSLQRLGCVNTIDGFMMGLAQSDPATYRKLADSHYEAAWRACNWDFGDSSRRSRALNAATTDSSLLSAASERDAGGGTSFGIHESLYTALRSLVKNNHQQFSSTIELARRELVDCIALTRPESVKRLVPMLINLKMLVDAENAWDLVHSKSKPQEEGKVMMDLTDENVGVVNHGALDFARVWHGDACEYSHHLTFDEIEPILALHSALLQIGDSRSALVKHLSNVIDMSVASNRPSIGRAALRMASLNSGALSPEDSALVRIGESRFLWSLGQHARAIRCAQKAISSIPSQEQEATKIRIKATLMIAEWSAESHSSSQTAILNRLKQAARETTFLSWKSELCRVFYELASFEDRMFQSMRSRTMTEEWTQEQALLTTKKAEVELQRRESSRRDARVTIAEKELKHDEAELMRQNSALIEHLGSAFDNFIKCLTFGDEYDMRVVYRVISLWFEHYHLADINKKMSKAIKSSASDLTSTIQSRKFLPLVYQIASRLHYEDPHANHEPGSIGEMRKNFHETVFELVLRMSEDHPHHCLYQLFGLKHGDRVKRNAKRIEVDINKQRKLAADKLISKLVKGRHQKLVIAQSYLIEGYVEIASHDTGHGSQKNREAFEMRGMKITSMRDRGRLSVCTVKTEVQHDCNYEKPDAVVFISGYAQKVKYAKSGITRPKIVTCHGSDGRTYMQLVKPEDDMRQDAVMQQVFGLVNNLLASNPETRSRQLSIRTYTVVPLTPCVGVLEWVSDTTSLSDYLTAAHAEHRPQDLDTRRARMKINESVDAEKLAVFREVCRKLRPVFHHFFLEKFLEPSVWFQKRIAYTRSVATNSITGYILGIGDRHCQNILIDTKSAEIIHIDFGIAFDQGRLLRTPECVPFRLTRDIVDGMGISGVEGTFRRCCEAVMRVLRTNQKMLLTVLEVFIHDPLYKWAMSKDKMSRIQRQTSGAAAAQRSSSGGSIAGGAADSMAPGTDAAGMLHVADNKVEGNRGAMRALLTLRRKLQGLDSDVTLSVEGQVSKLIVEARDISNLCRMYHGWAAWL